MENDLKSLLQKSTDPAILAVSQLDDAIRAVENGDAFDPDCVKTACVTLETRGMVQLAVSVLGLRARFKAVRKRRGIKSDAKVFDPFRCLVTAMATEMDAAEYDGVRKGQSLLAKAHKFVEPGLSALLEPFGVTPGFPYVDALTQDKILVPYGWSPQKTQQRVICVRFDSQMDKFDLFQVEPNYLFECWYRQKNHCFHVPFSKISEALHIEYARIQAEWLRNNLFKYRTEFRKHMREPLLHFVKQARTLPIPFVVRWLRDREARAAKLHGVLCTPRMTIKSFVFSWETPDEGRRVVCHRYRADLVEGLHEAARLFARGRALWRLLLCVTKVLALHMRAVVTANHPTRKRARGEFDDMD